MSVLEFLKRFLVGFVLLVLLQAVILILVNWPIIISYALFGLCCFLVGDLFFYKKE